MDAWFIYLSIRYLIVLYVNDETYIHHIHFHLHLFSNSECFFIDILNIRQL